MVSDRMRRRRGSSFAASRRPSDTVVITSAHCGRCCCCGCLARRDSEAPMGWEFGRGGPRKERKARERRPGEAAGVGRRRQHRDGVAGLQPQKPSILFFWLWEGLKFTHPGPIRMPLWRYVAIWRNRPPAHSGDAWHALSSSFFVCSVFRSIFLQTPAV